MVWAHAGRGLERPLRRFIGDGEGVIEVSIYLPEHFRVRDREAALSFIEANSFGMLVSASAAGEAAITHLPFLVDRDRDLLAGHLARANPHGVELARSTVALAVFSGPHAYVSPSWYRASGVPTWNYMTVHVRGTLRLLQEPSATQRIVDELTRRHEKGFATPWRLERLPQNQREKMLAAIVGFELLIERVDAKFKLSQNRSRSDQLGVIAALERGGEGDGARVAEQMRRNLHESEGD